MKRISFWEIFQNTDFRALNCQTAEWPKFASGESQKLDKLLSFSKSTKSEKKLLLFLGYGVCQHCE